MREYGVLITTVIIAQGPQGAGEHLPEMEHFPGVCPEVHPGPTPAPLGKPTPTT